MHRYVISDTSCLILFDKIGELNVLEKTFKNIITTSEVIEEYGKPVPEWIKVKDVNDKRKQIEFEKLVDKGEASAIALALEIEDCTLIIDDKKGRRLAQEFQVEITGTLGVLLLAKQRGVLSEIRPLLERLKLVDYRISGEIVEGVLKRAGE